MPSSLRDPVIRRAAIFPYQSIGDSLVSCVLAQNLANTGVAVDFYSNLLSPMGNWFPDFNIRPLDDAVTVAALLEYDLVICDPMDQSNVVTGLAQANGELLNKTLWFCCTRLGENYCGHLPASFADMAQSGQSGTFTSAPLRDKSLGDLSMVEFAQAWCRTQLGVANPVKQPVMRLPEHCQYRRHPKRVLIFPTSKRAAKDYPLANYLKLVGQLFNKGFEPELVTSQDNVADLIRDCRSAAVPVKTFADIELLAQYICESGAVVSNDSGGGHIASLLQLPTVTIYKKYDNFEWRPGWREGLVVRPGIRLKLLGRRIWKPFISRRKIVAHLEKNQRQQ